MHEQISKNWLSFKTTLSKIANNEVMYNTYSKHIKELSLVMTKGVTIDDVTKLLTTNLPDIRTVSGELPSSWLGD